MDKSYYCKIVFLFIFGSLSVLAQTKYEKNFYGGIFYISEFIASDEFDEMKRTNSDLQLVDSIYFRTLNFFERDYSETFLCLSFATLPFNEIKLNFTGIIIPLPSPSKKIFDERTKNLPKNLFIDSPKNNFGDKDKLAHFFGNAFIKYNFGWFNLSKFMGIFVEKVEDGFFTEGSYDSRDIVVNTLGELFGEAVKTIPDAKPSNILKIYQLIYFRLRL